MRGILLRKLEIVTRMAEIGKRQGLKRQVFVVNMPGFDTHDDQHTRHATLLRELSLSLWHFQQAIDALGIGESVTLFSQSDFGRTLAPNNSGTDHAWGGNQFVLGGAASGRVAGVDGSLAPDISETSQTTIDDYRGRFIPTLAHEQTLGRVLTWFGVPEAELTHILPRYHNFSGATLL